jgi:hypothetical protein
MKDIYYGSSSKDINLCQPVSEKGFYRAQNISDINLNSNFTHIKLVHSSNSSAYMDLRFEMSFLKNGAFNVYWNYWDLVNPPKVPFKVPFDVVDPKYNDLGNKTLATFAEVTQDETGPLKVKVKNEAGTIIWELDGMVLAEYYNYISAKVYTEKGSKGIMGLFERVSNDLFLPDGVYSLWSRDIPNPVENGKPPGKNLYGTHPVIFGKATDKSWFGLYTNLANAQDWWVTNNADGSVDLKTIATGGEGDLYFVFG